MDLVRNCSPVVYALYEGQEEIIDEYGNKTGSFAPKYSPQEMVSMCVSSERGDASLEPFGTLTDYDRVMSTADVTCPINEYSALWLDGADTSKPNNYYVKKRAPWKNSIAFAVKKVTLDGD